MKYDQLGLREHREAARMIEHPRSALVLRSSFDVSEEGCDRGVHGKPHVALACECAQLACVPIQKPPARSTSSAS